MQRAHFRAPLMCIAIAALALGCQKSTTTSGDPATKPASGDEQATNAAPPLADGEKVVNSCGDEAHHTQAAGHAHGEGHECDGGKDCGDCAKKGCDHANGEGCDHGAGHAHAAGGHGHAHGEEGGHACGGHNGNEAKLVAKDMQTFGAEIGEGEAITLAAITADPDKFTGKDVVVTGHVRAVCQKKGCWMELAEGDAPDTKAEKSKDAASQGARVVFKDYGFFVPMDASGSKARLKGTVELTRVTPGQVAHYELEGATFAKKYDDGSAREIRIVSTGVELSRI